jgi:quercetin dioxygenase-like cupin family protein
MKRPIPIAMLCLASMVWAGVSGADDKAAATGTKAATPEHRIILPGDLKWVAAPPSLPAGAKVAVLYGDPNAAGPFAMRILIPAGYAVPPHWHPADENVTVISGEFIMGVGEKQDSSKAHTLPAGAVSIMPAGVRHYAWSTLGAVIQVNAIRPWGITYVDPQDDPRGPPAAK